jgi:hypothetical protein
LRDPYIVDIDVDSTILAEDEELQRLFKETRRAVVKALGNDVADIIVRRSPSGRGVHAWIHLKKPIASDEEWLKYSLLLGDDPGRVYINSLRAKRGVREFDKIFSKHIWTKPIDEKCEECWLRRWVFEEDSNNI